MNKSIRSLTFLLLLILCVLSKCIIHLPPRMLASSSQEGLISFLKNIKEEPHRSLEALSRWLNTLQKSSTVLTVKIWRSIFINTRHRFIICRKKSKSVLALRNPPCVVGLLLPSTKKSKHFQESVFWVHRENCQSQANSRKKPAPSDLLRWLVYPSRCHTFLTKNSGSGATQNQPFGYIATSISNQD